MQNKEELILSIIVPTYNDIDNLKQLVLSISLQQFQKFEVLIMDGGSKDGTVEYVNDIIANDIKFRLYSEPDDGIYDAMNKGILKSKGKWVYFIGADDKLQSNVLSQVFSQDVEDYDVVYGNVVKVPSNIIYDGEFSLQKLFYKNICHQAIFYKRTVFDKLGLYNIKYKSRADYAINIQVFKQNLKIKYIPINIAYFNIGGLSSNYFDIDFWKDYKINYIIPFNKVIPNKKLYSILWRLYFRLLLDEKEIWNSFVLSLKIFVNECNLKSFLKGQRAFLSFIIKNSK